MADLSAWDSSEFGAVGQLSPTHRAAAPLPRLFPYHTLALSGINGGIVRVSSLPSRGRGMVRSASMWVPHRTALNVGRNEYVRSLPRQPTPSGEPRIKPWEDGALVVLDSR